MSECAEPKIFWNWTKWTIGAKVRGIKKVGSDSKISQYTHWYWLRHDHDMHSINYRKLA